MQMIEKIADLEKENEYLKDYIKELKKACIGEAKIMFRCTDEELGLVPDDWLDELSK